MRNENLNFDRVSASPAGSGSMTSTLSRLRTWLLPNANPSMTPRPIERRALIVAVVLAVVAWLIVLWFRAQPDPINIWTDQEAVFRRAVLNASQPYTVGWFVNPPWILLLIAPFSLLPIELSVLVQAVCYFLVMTAIIYRFGGDFTAVLITLTSFVALDAVIEMNVDWIVLLGLLVPLEISPFFLLLKPQLALGYYFGVPWRKWPVIVGVGLVILAITSLIWPNWVVDLFNIVRGSTLQHTFNIAPMKLLPFSPFLSWIIGAVLTWFSFRRQDPPLGILAWFFFTPYIALYSLVLLLGILAIRWRFLAIAMSATLWISAAFLLR